MRAPFLAKVFRGRLSPFHAHRSASRRATIPSLMIAALLVVFILGLFVVHPASASFVDAQEHFFDYSGLPAKHGEVIHRINKKSPKQLYIIGISHRDPETGLNNSRTARTQAEIFRIGEWLNRNRNLELLLPEGYFGDPSGGSRARPGPALHVGDNVGDNQPFSGLNNLLLFEKLSDETRFVNAEMLLMEQFAMRASQVENKSIYDAVRVSLAGLNAENHVPPAESLARLQYLQEVRTAALMQNIPAAIEQEVAGGAIRNRAAMFTIGLNHLADIIRYIEKGKIQINAPPYPPNQMRGYNSELNLLKEGYGITVIIPRTLADNRKLLRLMNLDRILLAGESAPVTH